MAWSWAHAMSNACCCASSLAFSDCRMLSQFFSTSSYQKTKLSRSSSTPYTWSSVLNTQDRGRVLVDPFGDEDAMWYFLCLQWDRRGAASQYHTASQPASTASDVISIPLRMYFSRACVPSFKLLLLLLMPFILQHPNTVNPVHASVARISLDPWKLVPISIVPSCWSCATKWLSW
jgi:hypothetical protein